MPSSRSSVTDPGEQGHMADDWKAFGLLRAEIGSHTKPCLSNPGSPEIVPGFVAAAHSGVKPGSSLSNRTPKKDWPLGLSIISPAGHLIAESPLQTASGIYLHVCSEGVLTTSQGFHFNSLPIVLGLGTTWPSQI